MCRGDVDFGMRVDYMTRYEDVIMLTYAGYRLAPRILARYGSRAYLSPEGFEHLLVPSRLAFLQRSASGTVMRYALR